MFLVLQFEQQNIINFGIIDQFKLWISKHFNMNSTNKKNTVDDKTLDMATYNSLRIAKLAIRPQIYYPIRS